MGLFKPVDDRLVIPRWRGFGATTKGRELGSLNQMVNKTTLDFEPNLKEQLVRWSKNPTTHGALEIVNSAFVANLPELAQKPAKYLLDKQNVLQPAALDLCQRIVNKNLSPSEVDPALEKLDDLKFLIQQRIQALRKSLRHSPYHPVRWVELSRWHLVNGKLSKAERSIRIALQLAPDNRFVLRSAVRFYIHKHARLQHSSVNEREVKEALRTAKKILAQSPLLLHDPWLLSADIVTSNLLDKTSFHIKKGLALIKSGNFSAFDLTELSAAIGTEELKSGSIKSSSALFLGSLIDPNDNAVAQAEWASHHLKGLEIDFNVQNSNEAFANHLLANNKLEDALHQSHLWCMDQPFSSSPAILASYISSELGNSEKALALCNFGLTANPENFTLLNNKTFVLAEAGQYKLAKETFDRIDSVTLNEKERVIYTATKGILEFCRGDAAMGREYYQDARELAKKTRDKRLEALTVVYMIQAEFTTNSNTISEDQAIQMLKGEFKNVLGKELDRKIEILHRRAQKMPSSVEDNGDVRCLSR